MRFAEILAAIEQDQHNTQLHEKSRSKSASASHQPMLTLRHIHALRKLRDRHAADHAIHLQQIQRMHSTTDSDTADAASDNNKAADKAAKDRDKRARKASKAALRSIKDKQKQHEQQATAVRNEIVKQRNTQ